MEELKNVPWFTWVALILALLLIGGAAALAQGRYAHDPEHGSAETTVWVRPLPGSRTKATVRVVASDPKPELGESVTFTVTVSGAKGVPTGSVGLYVGAQKVGFGQLVSGVAHIAVTLDQPGAQTVKAVYYGDHNYR